MQTKLIILSIVLALASWGAKGDKPNEQPSTAFEQQHAAMHKIDFVTTLDPKTGGHCTATAIGPHALLTAQHCFEAYNKIYLDDSKEPVVIESAFLDGNDHVIFITPAQTYATFDVVEERKLVVNEPVHFWGAPKKLSDVYRIGYFRGYVDGTSALSGQVGLDIQLEEYILPCYPGDSGSGILDAQGHIVGIVTMGDGADELSLPLAFSLAQLEAAKK